MMMMMMMTLKKKLHQWMALQLQECPDGRDIPEWMTKG